MDLSECTGPVVTGVAPTFVRFVQAMTSTLERAQGDEARILHEGTPLVTELIGRDDWLPDHLAVPLPGAYGQYLLYRDPADRFTAVAFVWDASSRTPIHDHTVWGIIGVLRGAETAERFVCRDGRLVSLGESTLVAGQIDRVSPRIGDIHQVRNALPDRVSISIHVYGADLPKVERHSYCSKTGRIDPIYSKPYDNARPLLDALPVL
jgi:predicted metal-dependent enzyme (double-stranded beta helix superfamily)